MFACGIVVCFLLNNILAHQLNNVEQLIFSLNKTLRFVDNYYYEMNLDGLLGMTLAEAQLVASLDESFGNEDTILGLLDHVRETSKKIRRVLPRNETKNVLFERVLTKSNFWKNPVRFKTNYLDNLGIYQNWTAEVILANKHASYNGVGTDVCLLEAIESYSSNQIERCAVSPLCQEIMFENRVDSGYLLTHRLLYMQILRQTRCIVSETASYIHAFCSLILKESRTNEYLNYPQHDIFLEQVVLCGSEGYEEFLNESWKRNIIEWQTMEGCYQLRPEETSSSSSSNIRGRSTNVIEFGCTDHTTGLGVAALALNLRYVGQNYLRNNRKLVT